MIVNKHQFVFELFKEDGTRIGLAKADPDWEPAREWTRFCALRRGLLPLAAPTPGAAIEPLWHESKGEPHVQGFRVVLGEDGSQVAAAEFPTSYFERAARLTANCLVERGRLEEGENVRFRVAAYLLRTAGPAQAAARFDSEEVEPFVPYRGTALSSLLAGAIPEGLVDVEDMPFFVPQRVLNEAAGATRAFVGQETGGILIGHLHRDSSLPEIFAEVTAQIPTGDSGSSTKLSFTPETWTTVRAAVTLRRKNEVYLGYWHSHPVREWCRESECSPEKLRTCKLARDFFSSDDEALLRAVFPRAWSVGLVCNDAPHRDLTFSLFGWRRGSIQPRGFYITEEHHAA